MVTVPPAEEIPELTPNCPEVAVKSTVAPETGSLAASTTVAVIVVEVDPSALTDAADEARMMAAADVAGDVVLAGVPPPLRQPVNPRISNAAAGNRCNLLMYITIPIERCLPDPCPPAS
ncbi:MAG: hypothetical protein NT159_21975 [Proteobacteria bacterium]|nr:hypothetical protein [Pseudomonadota bacterium]